MRTRSSRIRASGGAAVLSAMCAISRLQAPVRCIGVIPSSENMPGSRAIKPASLWRRRFPRPAGEFSAPARTNPGLRQLRKFRASTTAYKGGNRNESGLVKGQ